MWGHKTCSITKMDQDGGGEVVIDAEHLATVASKQGKTEVNQTLKHKKFIKIRQLLTVARKELWWLIQKIIAK
jgi:hypothetical protein